MKGTPIVLLANVIDLSKTITALDSPIWRAKLWIDNYTNADVPFMADDDHNYNRYSISLKNIIIDFVEYLRVFNYETLRNTDKAWMLDPDDPSILYIHFEYHNPPHIFLSIKHGIAIGFSYGKPILLGEIKTHPTLMSFPDIEEQADHFTYQRMKFNSGTVTIDNSTGILDELFELFGNDLSLLMRTKKNATEIVRQFFIERYTVGLLSVELTVKDKRSRLTFKAPNTYYTKEEFPHIEDSLLDNIIQDAYGYCRMAVGTCLNRNQIYNPPSFEPVDGFNNWFAFKFAREITSIEQVMVLMSDVWTEVFPGLGVPPAENRPGSGIEEGTSYLTTNPNAVKIIHIDQAGNEEPITVTRANMNNLPHNDGRIQIWWSQAMRHNSGFLQGRNGNANKVAMTGVFVNLHTPGDIVRDMMSFYGQLPYDASCFDLQNWENEMNQEHANNQIGLVLDSADNIFSWIERIQNGALIGFQLITYRNLFSARVDNPNRHETFNIKWHEIVNRDQLAPEMSGDMYATYTKINWGFDYANEEWQTVIDKSQRRAILDVYKFEKEYNNDTFLVNEEDAALKGSIILESFMQVRPIIRNIELKGLRENEISLFSTGWIDFSVHMPRQMKLIQKYMKERNHIGKMRVKVLGWRRDLKNDRIFIDVIQTEILPSLGPINISGEYPETVNFAADYDNKFPETALDEFKYIIDGGEL